MASDPPITRDDIKAKFSELEGQAHDRAETARNTLIAVGVVAAVVVGGLAFFMGRRRGKKEKTIVEIRRV